MLIKKLPNNTSRCQEPQSFESHTERSEMGPSDIATDPFTPIAAPRRHLLWGASGAVATATLLLPSAEAGGCTKSADVFLSPQSGVRYAITGGCPFTDDYLNRFKNICGAIPTGYDVGYSLWDIVRYTVSSTLRRDASHTDPRDTTFEACLKTQQGQENGHSASTRGIIIGAVLGGVALLLAGILLMAYCCHRARSQRREADRAPTRPACLQMPTF